MTDQERWRATITLTLTAHNRDQLRSALDELVTCSDAGFGSWVYDIVVDQALMWNGYVDQIPVSDADPRERLHELLDGAHGEDQEQP